MVRMRSQIANLKTKDLVALAVSLGRTRRPGSGHPMYVSPLSSPGVRSVAIPDHPTKPVKKYTASSIMNDLESDVEAWETKMGIKTTKTRGNGYG